MTSTDAKSSTPGGGPVMIDPDNDTARMDCMPTAASATNLGDSAALIEEGPVDAPYRVEHSQDGGTAVHGSGRGDGLWQLLKNYGRPGSWDGHLYLRGTRNKQANPYRVRAIAEAIAAHTGMPVAIRIDNRARSVAEKQAERAERTTDRATRLQHRANRAYTQSEHLYERAERATDGIPSGQPILEGHHSERKHRATLAKAHAARSASRAVGDKADRLQDRADAALANEEAKSNPRAMIRRREYLQEQERALLRRHDGEPHPDSIDGAQLRQLREEITLIGDWLAAVAASGQFISWSRDDFRPGDQVNIAGHWHRVIRANPKSVSVPWWGSRTPDTDTKGDTAPYGKVYGRRRDGWQIDTPTGDPWPVADAERVARWSELTRRAARPYSEPEDCANRARVRVAQRLVYGLPTDAADAEADAHRRADHRPARTRALEAITVYDRLDAGEPAAAIAATVTTAPVVPQWRMPTGQPIDIRVDQLRRGDIIAWRWDRNHQDRLRHVCGPIAWVSVVQDRRERGRWIIVRRADGAQWEFQTHEWCATYPAGQPTVRVADLIGGERVDVRGRDHRSHPTRVTGHLAAAPEAQHSPGAAARPVLALHLSETSTGQPTTVFTEPDAWCAVLPDHDPTAVDAVVLAHEAGAGAYQAGRPCTPDTDPTVRALRAAAAGADATAITQAFIDGFNAGAAGSTPAPR